MIGRIIAFFKGTATDPQVAAITYIWRLEEFPAFDFNEIRAVLVAGRAVPAFFIMLIGITCAAHMDLITGESVLAGIVVHVSVSDAGEYKMIADLFGYGGRIFVQSLPNLGERAFFIKHFLDDCTLFKGEMFLISHVSTSLLPGHSVITIP
jgi:hypothetical protein